MSYQFTDIPKFIPLKDYHDAIDIMVQKLLATGKVKGVYQVGGISTPGISDIDLYVVFHDNASLQSNPVTQLPYPANYLFTHRLFGTVEKHAMKLEQFTLFNKYNFLGGTPTELLNYFADSTQTKQLKYQIALEYLVKAWYSNAIAMEFGSVKLRNLLLHAKAILLDLEFLEIRSGKLVDCIHDIMNIRSKWFNNMASTLTLSDLVKRYDAGLKETINETISKYGFYLPENANYQLSKRVLLRPSLKLYLKRTGLLIPTGLTRHSKKLLKIQNRLNRFTLNIPIKQTDIPSIISERYQFMSSAFDYNHVHLPGFLCTGHGMNLFKEEN